MDTLKTHTHSQTLQRRKIRILFRICYCYLCNRVSQCSYLYFVCSHVRDRRDLVNQEARYAVQLEEAEKQAYESQTKANDLAYQISELERNLTVKIWNVERELLTKIISHAFKQPIYSNRRSSTTQFVFVPLPSKLHCYIS